MINGSTVFMMVFSESWFNRIIALLKKTAYPFAGMQC